MSGVGCTDRLHGGVQGRLAYLEPCNGLPDVQPVGDVLFRPLHLLSGDDRLASALLSAIPSVYLDVREPDRQAGCRTMSGMTG